VAPFGARPPDSFAAVPDLRWGLTLPFPGVPLAEHEALVRRAEERGYDDLWSGETNGPDGFTPLALAAAWTERIRLGTGVVNAFTRGPAVLAQHAAALQDASRGRFCLGIGSSSDRIVEGWNRIPFEKPLTRVRETVEALRPVLAGDRGPGGFRLEQPPAQPVPIVVAALRDRMLRLGGEVADGTFVNFLPLSAVEHVVGEIRAGEREAGREEGATEVVCRFFCIPGPPEEVIGLGRFMFAAYATVPVYEQFFRALGWGEQLDPMVEAWRSGDRGKAAEVAPEDLMREIFVLGSPEEQKARLEEYAERGITTFVLTPIAGPDALPGLIDALARS
jgi:probable F420-dependent oxidoreductase